MPSIKRASELGAPYSLATLIYLASMSKKLGISRREFLKGSLASAGLIGMSAAGLPILSTVMKVGETFVPDDSARRKIDAIAETIRPQF